MYTTCMHALRMHFLPATGLYGLARGSAAAAQRFAGSHAPLRGVFYAGFCAFKAVALRCAGAGANAAAPLRARKAMTARIVNLVDESVPVWLRQAKLPGGRGTLPARVH